MIPLRDSVPSRRAPYVVYTLIAANILMFIAQKMGHDLDLMRLSMVPLNVVTGKAAAAVAAIRTSADPYAPPTMLRGIEPPWITLFTSMFLHGNWLHVIGNMWYLWIFGNNIEDRLGHVAFFAFYIVSGLVAAGGYILSAPHSTIPTLGASGAVAGVLGAYFVVHPSAKVDCLALLGFFYTIVALPAALVLGLWFVMQIFSASMLPVGSQGGGVAWWAHISGFLFGALVILVLRIGGRDRLSAPGSYRIRYR
jgi:membrane associated rhomboid family serine protease